MAEASNKILLPQLISMLASASGKPKKTAEAFLKSFFGTIAEALENHDTVRIKGFGTFKVNRVEARKSVNVSTGADVKIPAHYRVVFTPSKTMAEKVNKEFSWLEIVEISETVSNEELDSMNPVEEEQERKELEQPVAITEEQEEESKKLGEELEEDFGIPEPSEPLGPLDPEDPEPGEPLPDDLATVPNEDEPQEREEEQPTIDEIAAAFMDMPEEASKEVPEPESVPEPMAEPEPVREPIAESDPVALPDRAPVSVPEPEPLAETQEPGSRATITPQTEPMMPQPEPLAPASVPEPEGASPGPVLPEPGDSDFDPYAHDIPQKEAPEAPEPFYITKDEFDSLATKSEFRLVARNIKKIKASIEGWDQESKKRSRKTFIWSVVICAALMTGGFFLIYHIIMDSLGPKQPIVAEKVEEPPVNMQTEENVDDEEYAPTSLKPAKSETETVAPAQKEPEAAAKPAQKEKQATATAHNTSNNTAPTSPSDIKAMDRVTNTRYLTTMAKEHYGNYNLWPYIYIENEGKLGHPDRIKPGTIVVIPNIEKYSIDPSNPKDIEKARKLGVEIYKKYANI